MNHILAFMVTAIAGMLCFAIGMTLGLWGIPFSMAIGYFAGRTVGEIYGWFE